ncbi:MAG: hypothetical protein ACLRT5_00125 [Lachnospiraceae bacterium]
MHKVLQIAQDLYQAALDKHETRIVNNILAMESFDPVTNNAPSIIKNIAVIVPTLKRYAGGHTSILRLGTYLEKNSYNVTYVSFHNQDTKQMSQIAHDNLSNVMGKFAKYVDARKEHYDVCIATSWESVYWTKQLDGYKMYFVQDFEPYFFKLNERYILAKKTYELGFHIVSLGKWNVKRIQEHCTLKGKVSWVDFPYEPSEYKSMPRDFSTYTGKKLINIAVYSKEEGKRIPNLLQGILKRASEELGKDGIKLKIRFFGFKKNHKLIVGENCGKLNKKELAQLYQKSDFGMVASMSNISLVPYEMIAIGLPVIEFSEGSYADFLPEDSAILIDFNYKSLVDAIENALNHPQQIEEMTRKASTAISSLSWERTGKEFVDILHEIEGTKV